MLITVSEFFNSGVPVSDDVRYEEVQQAAETVEELYLKPRIGDALYISLLEDPESELNEKLLNGGTVGERHVAGLKQALFHGVFAFMLADSIRLTRYASIEKDSEFSKNTSEADRMESARRHWTIMMTFTKEVQDIMDVPESKNALPDLFETLI